MAKQIARLLKADIQESSDLKSIAKMLSKKGRGGDTMLAHITPKEAKILKEAGGAGTVNPDTGLLEFYDGGFNIGDYGFDYGADYARQQPQQQSYDYIPPQQSFDSPYTFDAGTSPIELTAPDIEPAQYYAQQAAAYTPSADFSKYLQPGGAMADIPQEAAAVPMRTPADIYMAGQAPAGQAAGGEITPIQPGLSTRAGEILAAVKAGGGDVLEYLKKNPDLLRLAGAGVGAVAGAQRTKQLEKQVQQATQEQKQLASPYQKAGQEMQRAALAGELTPQSAQAFQALRAQMAQGIESRGGVGVAQAQAQLEAFRQNLLQNQYNYGIQVAQIGDQYAIGAIKTGLQLDQNIAAITNQFYSNLASIASGTAPARTQQ